MAKSEVEDEDGFIVRHKTIYNLTCFPGMSNPPYSPFSKGGFRGIFIRIYAGYYNFVNQINGISISVSEANAATYADYYVRSPEELCLWLEKLSKLGRAH
ncbi:MAG: hypothetical protein AUK39_02245 [Dehalococcoidia bacterium CG2_30_46_19]|nr:MAG: hypothetical protein AUK39_02245 [Dehalococcoidia bacterium CG2_30_46_19]